MENWTGINSYLLANWSCAHLLKKTGYTELFLLHMLEQEKKGGGNKLSQKRTGFLKVWIHNKEREHNEKLGVLPKLRNEGC